MLEKVFGESLGNIIAGQSDEQKLNLKGRYLLTTKRIITDPFLEAINWSDTLQREDKLHAGLDFELMGIETGPSWIFDGLLSVATIAAMLYLNDMNWSLSLLGARAAVGVIDGLIREYVIQRNSRK